MGRIPHSASTLKKCAVYLAYCAKNCSLKTREALKFGEHKIAFCHKFVAHLFDDIFYLVVVTPKCVEGGGAVLVEHIPQVVSICQGDPALSTLHP
jgi:hypothetical protein